MLLRKKTKSLIVVSLSIIGLASTSIVNARSLIASNTSLVQIESKGTHPTGSVTKGNYTVNSSILTKPSMGQAAARGILTVGSPKPAKDMGLSMTLWGTEYSLIAATPYYYNTNGTTAVSVTTRYADGYSTFTTGGDMKYNNLSSNWRFKQAKWISPYNKNSDKLVENVFENYKDILKIIPKKRDIEEETKIYFCGWRRNAVGQNVRDKNLEKTRSAFGDAKAEMCKRKNISSCWTDCASDEDLKKLNDIVGM